MAVLVVSWQKVPTKYRNVYEIKKPNTADMWKFIIPTLFFFRSHSPSSSCSFFELNFSKVQIWWEKNCNFSTLHEEASENHSHIFRLPLSQEVMVLDEQVSKNKARCHLDQGYHPSLSPSTVLEWWRVDLDPEQSFCHSSAPQWQQSK